MPTIRTSIAVVSALALLAISAPSEAHERPSRAPMMRPPMQRPLVSVAVLGARGMELPSAMHEGKRFVAGERGQRYAIALTNNTPSRIEVVVSVDGRDVVSGKRADFRTQRGYLLGPFETIEVEGFRQSLERVATFRFSVVQHSYAARRGNRRNVGVIGVAAFKERARPMMKKDRMAPRAGRSATPRENTRSAQELGTEYGESRMSAVRRVSFTRANAMQPDLRTAVLYDSMDALLARGVPIAQSIAVEPDPFPMVDDGFARPPGPMR